MFALRTPILRTRRGRLWPFALALPLVVLLPCRCSAEGTLTELAWTGNASCETWASEYTEDTESRLKNAVVHISHKADGGWVAVGRLPGARTIALPLALLCRTVDGATVSFRVEVQPEGQEPGTGAIFEAAGMSWERHTLAAPAEGAGAAYTRVVVTVPDGSAAPLHLCLLASSRTPTATALRGLWDFYEIMGQPASAQDARSQLERLPASAADALVRRYGRVGTGGSRADYEQLWHELQAELPLGDKWAELRGFREARAMADALPMTGYRLAALAEANEDPLPSAALAAGADGKPLGAVGVDCCLRLAEACLRAGERERALSLVLRVLLRDPDAGAPHPSGSPHNETYLQAANYLPTEDQVRRAVVVALSACGGEEATAGEQVTHLCAAWRALERTADDWDLDRLVALTSGLSVPADAAEMLACVHAAQVLLRRGSFAAAGRIAGLCSRASAPDPLLRLHSRYLRATAGVACGGYSAAMDDLQAAAGAGDRWLAATAGLELAEALEFTGKTSAASERYGRLAGSDGWWWARLRAKAALRRMERGANAPTLSGPSPIAYLGEDRQTRGAWYEQFGSEAFMLCAKSSPTDVFGGPLLKALGIAKRTGSDDPARSWLNWRVPSHPSFTWDPISDVCHPANWDDHGEVYLPGAGPDLYVTCEIPEGLHRLSLYFVNDCTYYEPGRDLTPAILNGEGRALAATQVRGFLHGVYKQFGVQGPLSLQVRISKSAGLNAMLSGVFLDPLLVPPTEAAVALGAADARPPSTLTEFVQTVAPGDGEPPPPSADDTLAAGWRSWRLAEATHREPAVEREALLALSRELASRRGAEALPLLRAFAQAEMEAGRVGVAIWSMQAVVALVEDEDDPAALRTEAEDAAIFCLQPRVVDFRDGNVERPACPAAARSFFSRALASWHDEAAAVVYCHEFAARFAWQHAPIMLTALRYIAEHAGAGALTNDELWQYPCDARNAAECIALLEPRIERPDGASDLRLWSKLDAAYGRAGRHDKSIELARRVAQQTGNDEERAHFIYYRASGLEVRGQLDEAIEAADLVTKTLPHSRASLDARELRVRVKTRRDRER